MYCLRKRIKLHFKVGDKERYERSNTKYEKIDAIKEKESSEMIYCLNWSTRSEEIKKDSYSKATINKK